MGQRQRVHIVSAVNAANVSKEGATYTIRGVCGAVDDIVMNGMLYPGAELAAGAPTLEGKPAPAGHPKNSAGQYISALNGEALASAWAGAYCRNARHEGGRTLCDVVVNEAQAKAHPDGQLLLQRLDAAISGENVDPIHVSTGVFVEAIEANGESRGKKYTRIATKPSYDHLAILLHQNGAGTPADGVGMWLNAEGAETEVERVELSTAPEDKRAAGLMRWVRKLLGNATDLSFDQISSGLYKTLQDGQWLVEVYDRFAIYSDRDGALWRQDYSVSSDGSVAWTGSAVQVRREVTYTTVTNQERDPMKDLIVAALNSAGITTAGKTDQQLLQDFEALKAHPVQQALNAANSKIAEFEQRERAAADAEATSLATELAANSSLTVDDLKKLGVQRLKELKTVGAKAAPVLPGASGSGGKAADEFAGYDLNAALKTTA